MSSKFIGAKTVVSVDSSHYKHFSDTLNEEREKRVVRDLLRDIVVFYHSLEETMQRMMTADKKDLPLDRDLFAKMVTVKEKYLHVETAFNAKDDDHFRGALIAFADATQDLMTQIHRKRKH